MCFSLPYLITPSLTPPLHFPSFFLTLLTLLLVQDYGNSSYWDERYAASSGEVFDWYQPYSTLKPQLTPYLSVDPEFEILIPGCGNSSLGADLYDDGYLNITNVDTSSVVISQMTDLHGDREEMEYTVMDCRNLEYLPDNCFDLIIDKALMDAQLCSEENIHNVNSMLSEMHRVLKPGGVYISISHGLPPTRLTYLNNKDLRWNVEFKKVNAPKGELEGESGSGGGESHFLYVAKKSGK